MGAFITDEIQAFIGMETELQDCADPIEPGAVRRFAQATMDRDPLYMDAGYTAGTRYGRPVAPPLFPLAMLRPAYDGPDLVTERAEDPDYDGTRESSTLGLPPLPLVNSPMLNGGTAVEIFRYAHHGERVRVKSRYKDIYERETSKGLMLFIIYESDFVDEQGDVIIRFTKTHIRR
ncbi:MAG TPA: MaoC family dehydratase N-terminal domain-containing protein [Devosia sp.]|nr:MaoC family dehydratase N-terminal domain-containing protein [Devosia sp.]